MRSTRRNENGRLTLPSSGPAFGGPLKSNVRPHKEPPMPFQRWQCAWPRTWPYALFKKHHTELNHLYWSNAAAATHALSTAGKGVQTDPVASVLAVPVAN